MISIDLHNDLLDVSHLKALLGKGQNPVLSIGEELAQFASRPVQSAIGSATAKIAISAATKWTTSTGIGFSLTPAESCSISIASTSTRFPVAKSIDSSQTQDIVSGPVSGKVYINIELDFAIAGSVSGSGAVSGIGISGRASGSGSATLSYCHAVDAGANTVDAVKQAFSALVFPLEPDCALALAAGDTARVNFDGSLIFGLDVTYGLGSFKFSAPGVAAVQQSLQSGLDKLTLPSVDVEAGAKASFSYTHTDHFGAIVQKLDSQTAKLYLVRSASNEFGVAVGVAVGVSVTPLTASLDKAALAQAVDGVTGSGGDKAAKLADQLQASLVGRTNKWLSARKGDAGLLVHLSQQTNRALLYAFEADLSNPAAIRQSWAQLAGGNVAAAAQSGGLTLIPGSGVGWELRRSVSIGLHFFNFFSENDKSVYFQKSHTELGPHGSIRFLYDVGKEAEGKTKDTLRTSRIHFVASAEQPKKNDIQNATVDLCVELSETNRANDGNIITEVIGSLPPSEPVQTAQTAMREFVRQSAMGTLNLVTTLKASGYQRLGCREAQDKANWVAYRDAVKLLMDLNFVSPLAYEDWELFNRYCTTGEPAGTPNRREPGNPAAVPLRFYTDRKVGDRAALVSFFFLSGARFMNLCEDLNTLAGTVGGVGGIDTLRGWNSLLDNLTVMAKDLSADWSRPSARALLQLCGAGGTVQSDLQPGGSKTNPLLTCTVTVS